MATNKQLEQQVEALVQLLAAHGISEPVGKVAPEKLDDYIEFGSPEHITFLGLVEVEDVKEAEGEYGYITHRSKATDITYRLEDQITQFIHFPDPAQVARLVLRQKVSSLESGKPKVPADAPPLWRGDLVHV